MLSKRSFEDRTLAESFYRALFNHFCDAFNVATQALLSDCNFGFAPSQAGQKTFFIVAPSLEVAEQLTQRIDSILNRVAELMVGVDRTAICFAPRAEHEDTPGETKEPQQFPPKFMLGKIFPITSETESIN